MAYRREERDGERWERRQAEEDEERLREERDQRSDELREAWRRNHPSEDEDSKDRPEQAAGVISGRPVVESGFRDERGPLQGVHISRGLTLGAGAGEAKTREAGTS
jgi:hypothetical protein